MRGFVILDFGSQYTQIIARRLRDIGFYSEIVSHQISIDEIKQKNPYGLILSGGPQSVYSENSYTRDTKELLKIAPLMGICYGFQLIIHQFGGKIEPAEHREYGKQIVKWKKPFRKLPQEQSVWMSHGDVATQVPKNFEVLAVSENHPAVMQGEQILGVQFHPEVFHTDQGEELFLEFAEMCKAEKSWNSNSMLAEVQNFVKTQVGADEKVLCALSGGVDSTVVATLLHKILKPGQLQCLFVDTGLLRDQEADEVMTAYKTLGLPVIKADARKLFIDQLTGVEDPEKKRKLIGRLFIETFDAEVKKLNQKFTWLAQGTLYPDVIESVSVHGSSVTIKSHHNVGGLPDKMNLKVLEPVRFLFKDEVRTLGQSLGIPESFIQRHPFPGPGLAIRILGEISESKIRTLQKADRIFIDFLKEKKLYHKIWQAFCVLLPVQSVGVQGDSRTYDNALVLRAVTSRDGMTADWYDFEMKDLKEVSSRITNKVKGINRVVYDVTSKPPATIEWE
jgi:GMP synthase (glutamine-hydrolysing)